MAERGEVPQESFGDKPAKPIIDHNGDNVIDFHEPLTEQQTEEKDFQMVLGRALGSVLLEFKRGEEPGSEWLEYSYDSMSEGGGGEVSDGEEEVDYPDDPDEVFDIDERSDIDELSEHDERSELSALSETDEPSDTDEPFQRDTAPFSRSLSTSKEPSKTKKQSDTDLAFEVAYDHQRRWIGSERTLPVPTSRQDSGGAETESRSDAALSSTAESLQRGSVPISEHATAGDQGSEEGAGGTESGVEQLRELMSRSSLSVSDARENAGPAEIESLKSVVASAVIEHLGRESASVLEHASAGDQEIEEGARDTELGVEQLRRLTLGPSSSEPDASGDAAAAEAESLESVVASSMIEHSGGNSASGLEQASAGDGGEEQAAEHTESGVEQPKGLISGSSSSVPAASGDAAAAEPKSPKSAIAFSTAESLQSSPEHASAEVHPGEGNTERVGSEVAQSHEETAETSVSELQQRRLARRLRREQNLAVPDLSKDIDATKVRPRKSTTKSSTTKRSERSRVPVPERAAAGHQKSEEGAGSKIQQDGVGGRLKTQRDRAISITDSEGSSFESRIADTLSSSTATVSEFETWSDRCVASLAEQIESMRRQVDRMRDNRKNGPLPVRPLRASWNARFTSDLDFEQVLPCAKRMRTARWRSQLWKARPYNTSEQTVITLRYPGRSKRCREVVRGIWEHARTVDLGQPTQQPNNSLSPQQWPKPAQQPIEPPSWHSFLESMKQPVQQTIQDPIRPAVPQPDLEHEQQSINETAQQLARMTVKDAITELTEKPVEQPVDASYVKEPVQQPAEDAVKPSEQSSGKGKLAKLLRTPSQSPAEEPVSMLDVSSREVEIAKLLGLPIKLRFEEPVPTPKIKLLYEGKPDQQPAEKPLKNPNPKLLLGANPEQEQSEQPTKKPSPKSPYRKDPAQRRVERSKRLNKDLGEDTTSPSSDTASSQRIAKSDLAVSGVMVVCDFQPTAPDISPLLPKAVPPSEALTLERISTNMDPEPPTPPVSETAFTTSLQSLYLSEGTDSCPLSSTPTETSKPDCSP